MKKSGIQATQLVVGQDYEQLDKTWLISWSLLDNLF